MAKLSGDGTYVIVEKGDTLSAIARDYGKGLSYKQLASLNNIPNPDLIYIGQTIKLSGVATSSGASSGSSSGSSNNSSVPVTEHFGLQANSDNTLFATWAWSKDHTDSYKTEWYYATGDGVWFIGSNSTTEYKQSTYSIPDNATKVKFRVKPISKTQTKNGNTTSYWTASWSTAKIYNTSDNPPKTPSAPSVEIEKYKLTAELDNLDLNATEIQFQVVKNNASVFKTGTATIKTNYASFSCTVDAGGEYKVRCRSKKDNKYSDWSPYSSSVTTIPSTPSGLTTCKASSETSVYLAWSAVNTATGYDIEYTTKKEYFDGSNQTTTVNNVEFTHYELTGLETGQEYFFRIRAVNKDGSSGWSGIKSVTIGKAPAAPTTWSSTTTAITGEDLNLYWVHNAEDESSQTYAELELYIDGAKEVRTIKNTEDEDEKDKTSVYRIDTKEFVEGTKIQWRVRTAGITKVYGDWSIERTIDIYAPPTLELSVTNKSGELLEVLNSFPFYVSALAGPNTQVPIGYQLTVTSNEMYETVDNAGNIRTVNEGEQVYSKYFDISDKLLVEFSASNIDLENGISYTISCTVSMNSGLTAQAWLDFTVSWVDIGCEPNAEISIDPDTLVAHIGPYCEKVSVLFYKAARSSNIYTATKEPVEIANGVPLERTNLTNVYTTTGEQVFTGTTTSGESVYYYTVEDRELVEGITLSVYRREFDGTFTELATGIDNLKNTFITDPHPALDYARYRIVAISNDTGGVSFCDIAGYPVGEKSIVIQWAEDWSNFDVSSDDELEQPAWSGSMLKLPYNVDIAPKYDPDVSLINYIGRKHPVSYYGTHVGESATWKVDIPAYDKETIYALRRLAIWMGDVYVREPSGSGYWAKVIVSFSTTHCEVKIPVTLDITRVEGGI